MLSRVMCPVCDTIQTIGAMWVDDGGELLTECEHCNHHTHDVPTQIIINIWEVSDEQ